MALAGWIGYNFEMWFLMIEEILQGGVGIEMERQKSLDIWERTVPGSCLVEKLRSVRYMACVRGATEMKEMLGISS
jgi:hypothetical protein